MPWAMPPQKKEEEPKKPEFNPAQFGFVKFNGFPRSQPAKEYPKTPETKPFVYSWDKPAAAPVKADQPAPEAPAAP